MRAREVGHMGYIRTEKEGVVALLAPEYPLFCANRLNFGGVELRTVVGGTEGFRVTVVGKNRRTALSRLHKEAALVSAAIS